MVHDKRPSIISQHNSSSNQEQKIKSYIYFIFTKRPESCGCCSTTRIRGVANQQFGAVQRREQLWCGPPVNVTIRGRDWVAPDVINFHFVQ